MCVVQHAGSSGCSVEGADSTVSSFSNSGFEFVLQHVNDVYEMPEQKRVCLVLFFFAVFVPDTWVALDQIMVLQQDTGRDE